MRTFEATGLFKPGLPLELVESEMPFTMEGQVLVRIAYAEICKTQLMEIDRLRGFIFFSSHLLGHEATGVVQEIGPGVSKVKPGDHLITSPIRGSGFSKDLPGSLSLFGKNETKVNLLSSGLFSFEDINPAISELRQGNIFRPILQRRVLG